MNYRNILNDGCNIACNIEAMKMRKKASSKNSAVGRFRKNSAAKRASATRASAKLSVPPAETSADVRRLSRTYKLSNEVVSRVTGASPRTVSYWNAGTPPQRSSVQKIKEVTRLFDALADIIKGSVIGEWLQRPNKQFDGSTPLQVIERGETDQLWRMIWQLREGNAG
jgi:DNA-binding transcriptional regulator YiaG